MKLQEVINNYLEFEFSTITVTKKCLGSKYAGYDGQVYIFQLIEDVSGKSSIILSSYFYSKMKTMLSIGENEIIGLIDGRIKKHFNLKYSSIGIGY